MTREIVEDWLRDLPQQFQDKEKIAILIRAFAKQMQALLVVFDDLNTKTTLDTAVGKNLDRIGEIVQLSRKEAGVLAHDPELPVMEDERYRQFLRYKIQQNTNNCTYYDLIESIVNLWHIEPVYYKEDPNLPATIILETVRETVESSIFAHTVPVARAAGVGLLYRIAYDMETDQLKAACFIKEHRIRYPDSFTIDQNIEGWYTDENGVMLVDEDSNVLFVE